MLRSTGDPILYLQNPAGFSQESQKARIEIIEKLNAERLRDTGDAAIASRMHSYELAFRMQMAAPKLLDFSDESASTLEMYGVKSRNRPALTPQTVFWPGAWLNAASASTAALAHATWDDHQEINKKLKKNWRDHRSRPAAALLKDLKQRGLLDSTLVIWGGEFGRTPMAEQQHSWEELGRDHHPNCFSMYGWRGAGSKVAKRSAKLMSWESMELKIESMFTICRQLCCTASAWTIPS